MVDPINGRTSEEKGEHWIEGQWDFNYQNKKLFILRQRIVKQRSNTKPGNISLKQDPAFVVFSPAASNQNNKIIKNVPWDYQFHPIINHNTPTLGALFAGYKYP